MSTQTIVANGLVPEPFVNQWLARAGQALQRFDGRGFVPRHDAAESAFTQRALTFIATEVFPTLIPPLKARQFIPTVVKGNPGAETYVWRKPTRTGIARLHAQGGALDSPVVGLTMEEVPQHLYTVSVQLKYNYFELLAVGMALENGQPVDLVGEKLKAALEAIEKKLDLIAAFGTGTQPSSFSVEIDADVGLTGLLNSSLSSVYTTPQGAYGSKTWALKTADEVLADLFGIVAYQRSSTYEVHGGDTLVVPVSEFNAISGRRLSDVSGETILSFFVRTQREAKQPIDVFPWYYLSGAGLGSSDMGVLFKRDPRMLEHVLTMDASPLEPTKAGLETSQQVVARTAGLIQHYPLSVTTMSYIG